MPPSSAGVSAPARRSETVAAERYPGCARSVAVQRSVSRLTATLRAHTPQRLRLTCGGLRLSERRARALASPVDRAQGVCERRASRFLTRLASTATTAGGGPGGGGGLMDEKRDNENGGSQRRTTRNNGAFQKGSFQGRPKHPLGSRRGLGNLLKQPVRTREVNPPRDILNYTGSACPGRLHQISRRRALA